MNKKNIFIVIIISIGLLIMGFIYNYISYKNLENIVLDSSARMVTIISEYYPDIEEEVVKSITGSEIVDYAILDKYNVDRSYLLSSIEGVQKSRTNFFIWGSIINIFIVLVIVLIFIIYFKKEKNEINRLSIFLNNALHDKYDCINLENNESDLKRLENDLYKIITKMKNQNTMLKSEKILLKDYISDISHQLKTPLTTIGINNDILDKNNLNDKDRERFLNNNLAQINKMNTLIYNLLKLSRLDADVIEFDIKKININKMLDEIKSDLLYLMEKRDFEVTGKLSVMGDYIWLKEAITNIIKNAFEYGESNVLVELGANPLYNYIRIINDGKPITKKDIKHIFDRFYKTKNSSRDSIGIGLAISKGIINKLNGDIIVTSDDKTIFEIRMYKGM